MREKSAKKKAGKRKTASKASARKKPSLATKAKTAKQKTAPKKTAPKKTAPKKKIAKKSAAKKKIAKKSAAKKKTAKKKLPAVTKAKAPNEANPAPAARLEPLPAADPPLEVAALIPHERALTDEEREAMTKVAQTALLALETEGLPDVIVARIGQFVDEIRAGLRAEPQSQDIRLGLGVLWGEQVRAQVGWRWVHLSYPNGFASYALVPDDRAFACFPLNRITELMAAGRDAVNTSLPLFDSIRLGLLPARRDNEYLVIG